VNLEKQAPELAHWSEQAYRAAVESAHPERILLVSETQGRLESFLVARFMAGECELEGLLVAARSRRRGMATRLLHSLIQTARERGARKILLEVRESNVIARSFYRKLGFSQTGLRKTYYLDPCEDALLYSIDL
jgi:ribosomal-protein-alanine N-acetyltransferase